MKLRIKLDGTVCGLWSDAVDWSQVGPLSVRRASHVEFCERKQQWYVRAARPRGRIRRILQWTFRCPLGEVLYWASTRQEALAWEHAYYSPDGPGWTALRGA